MNPELNSSQKTTPQIPELCDAPQIRKEQLNRRNLIKDNKVALANLTPEFVALNFFLIDKLHYVNKNINLIKKNMNNCQILDEVKHLRDNNNSKNAIIKLLTEDISDIIKHFSNEQIQEKSFISPKKLTKIINKTSATDKTNVSLVNRFLNLIFNGTDDLETGTDQKTELFRLISLI